MPNLNLQESTPLHPGTKRGHTLWHTVRCVFLSNSCFFLALFLHHPDVFRARKFSKKKSYASKLGNTFIVHQAHLELQIDPSWDRITPGVGLGRGEALVVVGCPRKLVYSWEVSGLYRCYDLNLPHLQV